MIVCGLGRKGFRLANQFLKNGNPVVVIEVNEQNDWIGNVREAGAVVIHGDAADADLLSKVKLNRASVLVSVVGDDGKNAEVGVIAEEISRTRPGGCLTCIVHISDSQLWHLLRQKELQFNTNPHFRFELFNIYDRGAHLLVQSAPPWLNYHQDPSIQVLVVGLGKMGRRVVYEVSRGWKMQRDDLDQQVLITIVDLEAESKLKALIQQHPHIDNPARISPLNMDIQSLEFDRLGNLFLDDGKCKLDVVYICLDDESFCLQTGLRLNHQLRKFQVPIVLRMVESGGLSLLMNDKDIEMDSFSNLRIFDLLDKTCSVDLLQKGTHEILARSLHGVYLENLKKAGDQTGSDPSTLPWELLPEDIKENNRQLADRIPGLLAEVGYRIGPLTNWDAEEFRFQEGGSTRKDQVTWMARKEHEDWCQRKEKEGWKLGNEKNAAKKTHPTMLAWEELPESEREKNRDFIRGIPRLLARAGFQVEE